MTSVRILTDRVLYRERNVCGLGIPARTHRHRREPSARGRARGSAERAWCAGLPQSLTRSHPSRTLRSPLPRSPASRTPGAAGASAQVRAKCCGLLITIPCPSRPRSPLQYCPPQHTHTHPTPPQPTKYHIQTHTHLPHKNNTHKQTHTHTHKSARRLRGRTSGEASSGSGAPGRRA